MSKRLKTVYLDVASVERAVAEAAHDAWVRDLHRQLTEMFPDVSISIDPQPSNIAFNAPAFDAPDLGCRFVWR